MAAKKTSLPGAAKKKSATRKSSVKKEPVAAKKEGPARKAVVRDFNRYKHIHEGDGAVMFDGLICGEDAEE